MSTFLDIVSLEPAACGLEIGDVVARLADEPHAALGVHEGVTGPGALPGHGPFLDVGCDGREGLGGGEQQE